MVRRDSGTGSGGLEADQGLSQRDLVTVSQDLLLDAGAIDLAAVGGSKVDEYVVLALASHLGVAAADVAVLEDDVALGLAADGDRLVPDGDPAAVGQEQGAGGVAARPGDDLAGDQELTLAERGVGRQVDLHRADEVVALVAGMLTHRFGEFPHAGLG